MKKLTAVIVLLALLIPFALGGCTETKGNTDLPVDESTAENETVNETEAESGKLSSPGLFSSGTLGSAVNSLNGAGVLLYVNGMVTGEVRSAENRLSGELKNAIEALTFEEGIEVPYDEESGYPMGRNKFLPASFTHALDNTSVLFRKFLSTGELLEITADFYRMGSNGTLEKYYSVRYEDAVVISVGSASDGHGSDSFTQAETVRFTYQRATYTYTDSGFSYTVTR